MAIINDSFQQKTEEGTVIKISQSEIQNFKELKSAAQYYISYIQQLKANLKNFDRVNNQQSISSTIKNIRDKMKSNDRLTKIIFRETNIFKEKLNIFLGREIPLTYIDEEGNILALSSYTENQIYQKSLQHNTAGRGRIRDFSEALTNVSLVEHSIQKEINKRLDGYREIFTQAIRRSNKPEEEMKWKPSKGTYYWRLYDHHISGWSKPMSKNEIAEQYADVVLNRTSQFNTEYGLMYMSRFFHGHNWASAITGGDVSLYMQGQNISLAIKFGDEFQTQGFRQYAIFAYNVLNMNFATKKDIEQNIRILSISNSSSKKSLANNIVKNLNQKYGPILSQQAQKLLS